MNSATPSIPGSIQGISFHTPPLTAILHARDGKVQIPYGDLSIPLLDEDFATLDGEEPSYDAIGRGIYYLLRHNPDLPMADRYAALLKEGYPHLLAELATNLMMLDKKDVDIPYLDRKINYLKIFSLLEPDNHRFPLEIGATFLAKGLTLAAMGSVTILLYNSEKYLRTAFAMNPDDVQTRHQLGETCYLLGRYEEAAGLWEPVLQQLPEEISTKLSGRIKQIRTSDLPPVPPVDFLQAVGVALESYEAEDWEEASAIILDAIDALQQFEEFPLAEINYLLGLCYVKLEIPRYAEQYLRAALQLRPDLTEAAEELRNLGVE